MIDKFLQYINATKSHNTYTTYKAALDSYGGLSFTQGNLVKYIADQQERGVSASTIKGRLSAFAVYLRWAHKDSEAAMSVIRGFKATQAIQPCPSDDDIAAILDAIESPFCYRRVSKKYKAIFLLACQCGLRVSEIVKIRMADYDGSRITLRGTKNRTDAIVKLTPAVRASVDDYLTCRIDCAPTLFTCYHGALPMNSVQVQMKRYMEAAGCGQYHMHSLRRYFANRLDRAGVQLSVLQNAMRHKSVNSTMTYINVDSRRVEEAIENVFGR